MNTATPTPFETWLASLDHEPTAEEGWAACREYLGLAILEADVSVSRVAIGIGDAEVGAIVIDGGNA